METPAEQQRGVGQKWVSTRIDTAVLATNRASTLVYYHGGCPDGKAAAWVAWSALGRGRGKGRSSFNEEVRYVPVRAGELDPSNDKKGELQQRRLAEVEGQDVVVLDASFPAAALQRMIAVARSFLVLDHHKSSEQDLHDIPDKHKVFVMGQSGATLAWNFFFPDEPVPRLLRYVEDRDLWRWLMNDSKAYSAGVDCAFQCFRNARHDALKKEQQASPIGDNKQEQPAPGPDWLLDALRQKADGKRVDEEQWFFEFFDELYKRGDQGLAEVIAHGRSVLAYQAKVIEEAVRAARPRRLLAFPAVAVKVVNCTALVSEVGEGIYSDPTVDVAMTCFYNFESRNFKVSLRSNQRREPESVDTIPIARHYGGGGHRNASGFTWNDSIESLFAPEPSLTTEEPQAQRPCA